MIEHELKCQYCGSPVKRVILTRKATCFNCKRHKNLIRQEEYRKSHEREYKNKKGRENK